MELLPCWKYAIPSFSYFQPSADIFHQVKLILENYQNLVILPKIKIMGRNTSVSLGNYFENFVDNSISEGRFKNASEVIRAGLRLLEEEENKIVALKKAINEGIDSGIAENFNPTQHLESLKTKKRNA